MAVTEAEPVGEGARVIGGQGDETLVADECDPGQHDNDANEARASATPDGPPTAVGVRNSDSFDRSFSTA